MAIQKGIIKLKGGIGDLSFYKSIDGFVVRRKGGPSAGQIKHGARFVRTRENISEFGRASQYAKLLRRAFQDLLKYSTDARMSSRLTATMLSAIKLDPAGIRGKRELVNTGLGLVNGFSFNLKAKVSGIFRAPVICSVDRAAGKISVIVTPFTASEMVAPKGASHCRLVAGGAEIDFAREWYTGEVSRSEAVALQTGSLSDVRLTLSVTAGTSLSLVVAFGVEFYQDVNGEMYALQDKGVNALDVVLVDSLSNTGGRL
jgi:hypothetical protein